MAVSACFLLGKHRNISLPFQKTQLPVKFTIRKVIQFMVNREPEPG